MKQLASITKTTITGIAASHYFKILATLATLLFQFYYFLCVQYEQLFVISSAMLGMNNTIFFFGNLPSVIVPLLQLGVVTVVLIESDSIIKMEKIQELAARPSRNWVLLVGLVAGSSTMIFAVAAFNVSLIFLATGFAWLADLKFGNVPSLVPALNLLVFDLPPTMLFWSSVALFIRIFVKNSIVTFAIASIAVTFAFLMIFVTPFHWIGAVASYSYDVMVISDILPRFPDVVVLLNRATLIISGIALIVFSSLLWKRMDVNSQSYVLSGSALLLLSSAILFAQVSILQSRDQDHGNWLDAHRSFDPSKIVDLLSLSGDVTVDPGRTLGMDVSLKVRIPNGFAASELTFSFNPGMTINQLSVDESEQDFEFENGLLSIPSPCDPCEEGDEIIVSIEASGQPDELFGNPEPEIDYLRSAGVLHHVRKIFGSQNSIFSTEFVALTPASRWYPVPGPLAVDKYVDALRRAPDLFDVALNVTVVVKGWDVAGPGIKIRSPEDSQTVTFQTEHEIPHFAIIASRFESRTATVEGLHVESLIHARHSKTLAALEPLAETLTPHLAERLQSAAEVGVRFKHPSITFVELPSQLRTVSGHGMKFLYSFPSVILIKEFSLPLSNVEDIVKKRSASLAPDEELSDQLTDHFRLYNERNFLGGDIGRALAEQLYPYAYRQFVTEHVPLNYLRRLSLGALFGNPAYGYLYLDAEMVVSFAQFMTANPLVTFDFLSRQHDLHYPLIVDSAMYEYLFNLMGAGNAESVKLSELDTVEDSMDSFKLLHMRVANIHEAMSQIHVEEVLHEVISAASESVDSADGMDSLEYLYGNAELMDINLGTFVRDWLTADAIPAFRASAVESKRVDVQDDPSAFQLSFNIRNDQDVDGVVQFWLGGELEDFETGSAVTVPANSSYRVNLYSLEAIQEVYAHTFHSKNQVGMTLIVHPTEDDEATDRIRPMLEPSSWISNEDDEYIVVDNLDEGVELLGISKESPSKVQRINSWLNVIPDYPRVEQNGLAYGWTQDSGALDRWIHTDVWTTYGKYVQSAWQTNSESAETVRFTAELPSGGNWNLQYYFPYQYPHWPQYGRYNFVLHDGAAEHPIAVDAKGLSGWVELGTYDIVGPTVQLDLVSVEPSDSRRMADAIRWKKVEN